MHSSRSKPDALPCIWSDRRKSSNVKPSASPSNRSSQRSLIHLTGRNCQSISSSKSSASYCHAALLNCRSISDKAPYLNEFITDNSLDILFLTETWQVPDDFLQLNILTPHGFKYLSRPRLHGRGGGLAVIYRDNLRITQLDFHDTDTWF